MTFWNSKKQKARGNLYNRGFHDTMKTLLEGGDGTFIRNAVESDMKLSEDNSYNNGCLAALNSLRYFLEKLEKLGSEANKPKASAMREKIYNMQTSQRLIIVDEQNKNIATEIEKVPGGWLYHRTYSRHVQSSVFVRKPQL